MLIITSRTSSTPEQPNGFQCSLWVLLRNIQNLPRSQPISYTSNEFKQQNVINTMFKKNKHSAKEAEEIYDLTEVTANIHNKANKNGGNQ
jgi:hypothetical protein